MKTQDLKHDRDIFIWTPLGTIRLEKTPDRHLRLHLPKCMISYKLHEPEMEMVVEEKGGRIFPKGNIFVAVVNKDGEMIGLKKPEAFRLDLPEVEPEENEVIAEGSSTTIGHLEKEKLPDSVDLVDGIIPIVEGVHA